MDITFRYDIFIHKHSTKAKIDINILFGSNRMYYIYLATDVEYNL